MFQTYPRHFALGMIGTVEFKRLIAKALWEGFLENRTTSVLIGLIEREAITTLLRMRSMLFDQMTSQ